MAAEIAAKRPVRSPEQFVALVSRHIDLALPWKETCNAIVTRLRDAGIPHPEMLSLLTLAVAMAAMAKFEPALEAISQLSKAGVLTSLLHHNAKRLPVAAAIIAATILANPAFERPEQANQSAGGDGKFNEIVDASSFDDAIVQAVAEQTTKRFHGFAPQRLRHL